MPAMFSLLERFPDADFGSPGLIVHELEAIYDAQGGHAHLPFLRDSLTRKPTPLTVWMVNRLLNAPLPKEQREFWLSELHGTFKHPLASEETRRSIEEFLSFQVRKE